MQFKKKPLLEVNPLEKYGVLDQSERKNTIQVICRIQPKLNNEKYVNYLIQNQQLSILKSDQEKKVESSQTFQFTSLFDQNSKQEELYQQHVVPLINSVFKKVHNGLVFTFGINNSGRSDTALGNQKNKGILLLTLETLHDIRTAFTMNKPNIKIGEQIINLRDDEFIDDEYTYKLSKIDYSFSSIEIYNDEIYDLQNDQRKKLYLRELCDRKWELKDVIENQMNTIQDCRYHLNKTFENKQGGSHLIIKIYVELTYKAENYQITKKKTICIMDMGADTQQLQAQESSTIDLSNNKSFMVFSKCLEIMQTQSNEIIRVPYNECKLTSLLADYFTEDNKIVMIVNVKLTESNIKQTLTVLHYGALSVNVDLFRSRIYDQYTSFCESENHYQKIDNKNPHEIIRRAKIIIQNQSNCMKFQQEIQNKQAQELIQQFKAFSLKLKIYKETMQFNSLDGANQNLNKSETDKQDSRLNIINNHLESRIKIQEEKKQTENNQIQTPSFSQIIETRPQAQSRLQLQKDKKKLDHKNDVCLQRKNLLNNQHQNTSKNQDPKAARKFQPKQRQNGKFQNKKN